MVGVSFKVTGAADTAFVIIAGLQAALQRMSLGKQHVGPPAGASRTWTQPRAGSTQEGSTWEPESSCVAQLAPLSPDQGENNLCHADSGDRSPWRVFRLSIPQAWYPIGA